MDQSLIAALRNEEHAILQELCGSMTYQRLQQVRELLDLYDAQPPIGAALDAMLADRQTAVSHPPLPIPPVIALRSEMRGTEVA
ncbi:hypothetical protein [Neoroseomonas soli]|uniref:Uncharacterized protein n=1 Tax=Neoroseomonas soli TaxID=1081025 RepID=A0A9X9X2D4_9PROT|nr:hypothetical protein [Neoroseomonas soli]MBR0673563.1 hypothetical protein [Neoroseomonas soli]